MAKNDKCKSELVFPVVFYPEGKSITAVCPIIGVASQGDTWKEAKKNIAEAIDMYMEDPDTPKDHLI